MIIALDHSVIEWTDYGAMTVYKDGKRVPAAAHFDDPHYRVLAHRLGYGDDVMAYCREHDFCHEFLNEKLRGTPSPVMRGVAEGQEVDPIDAAMEEAFVMAFQRFLRANERPIIGGIDWDKLKADAIRLLGRW